MKLLTALLSTSIALAPVTAFALPVTNLKFNRGSYCGYTKTNPTNWYSVNVKAGQDLTILIADPGGDGYHTLVLPDGREIDLSPATVRTLGGSSIAYAFTVHRSGNYQVRSYLEDGSEYAYPLSICAK